MKRLNLDHVAAVSRAEGYMQPAIVPNMSPNHRKCIEDDLTRLSEVKKWVLKALFEPGLPVSTKITNMAQTDGDTNQGNHDGI